MKSLRLVSRLALIGFFLIHLAITIRSNRAREKHITRLSSILGRWKARDDFRDGLVKIGDLCVTYGKDNEIVEHHKAQMSEYGFYYCPNEDFHIEGVHGMLRK